MSSLEKRLDIFRQLPLTAQLAMINATKANSLLSQNLDYIASLEAIHALCLANASPEAQDIYYRRQSFLA